MELPPVVCPECAATYRHPGRSGVTKCKACGAEIHVVVPQAAPPTAQAGAAPPLPPSSPAAPAARSGGIVTHGTPHARRHGTHHHAPSRGSGPSPALIWSSVAAVAAVVVIIVVAASGSEDEGQAPGRGTRPESLRAQPSISNPWDDSDAPSRTGDGARDSGQAGASEAANDKDTTAAKAPEAAPKPRPAKKKPTIKKERYLGLALLAPVAGCTSEDKSRLEKLVKDALDDAYPAAANRAAFALRDEGKNAIPFLINAFVGLDLETVDRRVLASGNRLNEILQDISRKRYSFDDRNEDETGTINRLRCRYFWHLWWKREGATWQPPKEGDG